MPTTHEERIRIEMSYPTERAETFERIKAGIEAKYPDVDLKGRETERNGSEVMITLTFVPRDRNPAKTEESDPGRKTYESTPTSAVHDFVTALIEEHSAREG
jgi:hypothetical protein